jgi:hypothetical protein
MNVVSGALLLALMLVVALAPRRWALLAMLSGLFFLTQGHSVEVFGLSLYPTRFLEVAAFARVLLRQELAWSRLNKIDWTLLLLYNYTALVWIVRSSDVTAQQFAYALDATLWYLALRGLVGSLDDVRWLLNAFVVLLVPYTALVSLELLTGRTAFGIVGASWSLYIRDGIPRCQGSFRHPILLGSVAASFFAIYLGAALAGPRRTVATLGGVLALVLVVLSHSGGPLTSAAAAVLGWVLWPFRTRMRHVRWGVLGLLVVLLLFMKAPIWYLPFKISEIVGGGGYHRGLLMDMAWQHLGKWWLIGMDVSETASWIPYVHEGVGGADVTNHFLGYGIKAGLLALVLAIAVLVFAFQRVGRAMAIVRNAGQAGRADELLFWGLGVAVFVHAVSWLGVLYFDQSIVIWFMHLAVISGAADGLVSPHDAQHAPGTTALRSRPRARTAVVSGKKPAAGSGRYGIRGASRAWRTSRSEVE